MLLFFAITDGFELPMTMSSAVAAFHALVFRHNTRLWFGQVDRLRRALVSNLSTAKAVPTNQVIVHLSLRNRWLLVAPARTAC
jgi:hypothetical protein